MIEWAMGTVINSDREKLGRGMNWMNDIPTDALEPLSESEQHAEWHLIVPKGGADMAVAVKHTIGPNTGKRPPESLIEK